MPTAIVRVLVSSAQRGDCASGTQFSISLQDLQDMHNAFREHMDEGLNQLSQNQGKNGLPMGPAGNPTPYADGTAQPDPNAQSDLQAQQQAAQQAEQDVQGGSGANNGTLRQDAKVRSIAARIAIPEQPPDGGSRRFFVRGDCKETRLAVACPPGLVGSNIEPCRH